MMRRLAVAALLVPAYLFLHLPVEDFFDLLAKRFGFETYDRFTFGAFLAFGVAVLAAAWLWPSGRRILIGGSMTALLALMALVQRLLVVASIENIHYPQYALLVCALAWALPSIESAWLATTALGVVDEAYQYAALPRGTPDYFDWNDIVLNAIGAALGVVVILAFTKDRAADLRFSPRVATAAMVALLALAFLVDPPVLSPFFSFTPGGRPFHRLSAGETAIVVAGLWAGVRAVLAQPSPKRPNT